MMTCWIHNCFILQYVYYNPVHVSSIVCPSSGGWIVLMQHLVSSLSVSGRPVHLRENCLNLCTGRPLTDLFLYIYIYTYSLTLHKSMKSWKTCWIQKKSMFFVASLTLSPTQHNPPLLVQHLCVSVRGERLQHPQINTWYSICSCCL